MLKLFTLSFLLFSLTVTTAKLYNTSQPSQPLNIEQWSNKTIVFVSAHPDDIEACAAGTISQLTTLGASVHYVIFTNGNKGCQNPLCMNMTNEQLANTREKEQINAASVIGVPTQNLHFLRYNDSELTTYTTRELQRKLVTVLRIIKPDILLTWESYPNYDMIPSDGWQDLGFHPDHQHSGLITETVKLQVTLSRLWPELGPAVNNLTEFYQFCFLNCDYYNDITDSLNSKIKSFQAHSSQFPSPSIIPAMMSSLCQRVANGLRGVESTQCVEGFRKFS